jgi:hypothetical protein
MVHSKMHRDALDWAGPIPHGPAMIRVTRTPAVNICCGIIISS